MAGAQVASTLIATLLPANAAGWVSHETDMKEELDRLEMERAAGIGLGGTTAPGQAGQPIPFGRPASQTPQTTQQQPNPLGASK